MLSVEEVSEGEGMSVRWVELELVQQEGVIVLLK